MKSQTPPEFWEAELKAMEGWLIFMGIYTSTMSIGLTANILVFTDTHHQDDQEPTASSSREEGDQLKIQTPPEYCEAELKTTEGWLVLRGIYTSTSNGLTANIAVSTNSHHKEDQEQKASSSGDKGKQSEKTHPEYGLVIGIGMYLSYPLR